MLQSVEFEASCQNEKTLPGYAAADQELDFNKRAVLAQLHFMATAMT